MNKQIYGETFLKIIPKLNELAIEESFFSDDETDTQTLFQDVLLSLIRYVLKTVSIKSLIKSGLKQKSFQFVIVTFCRSIYIPHVNSFL